MIEMSGFELGECLEASQGQEACALLQNHWVDVILTDICMPVMNGEEFVCCLKKDELLRNIPVMVVSTDGSEHLVQRMLALGAKGYVKKPFYPEGMRDELERVLGVTDA